MQHKLEKHLCQKGAVGDDSTILHTEDGGKSWIPQVSNTKNRLPKNHSFPSPSLPHNLGWAVGQYGTIVQTEDGSKKRVFPHPRDSTSSMGFGLSVAVEARNLGRLAISVLHH